MTDLSSLPKAGFLRRLGALFYDFLIVIAIEMIAAGIVIAVLQALMKFQLLNLGPYADIADLLDNHPIWSHVYLLYLVVVWVSFYLYFWGKAGQTLGMRAWRLKLIDKQGNYVTNIQIIVRLISSLFGLANLLALFGKRGLQDIIARTEVIVLPQAN
ncbi:RDD family protein [Vibrio marisflavi]|uniref:RDD domain-containing protein n=1 Tax=Vibrio marisflavi CECT 7928 TaxID=634439 RepID=A0ABM9A8A6_9VIBR|nr:RDD family protein [Vibrio marisflavi]CAH0541477.1 hypothetical protein VMF7928_03585 [Vibrio marisflavi CECT 7928]